MNEILEFLKELAGNNNKPWFDSQKERYLLLKEDFENEVQKLIEEIAQWDASFKEVKAKDCLYRIYKDTRFSKNKEPYKINFGAFISSEGKKSNNAAYYIHIQPEGSFIGGGVYAPNSFQLKAIRTAIFNDAQSFKNIIEDASFKKCFGSLFGDKLKTAPKGFPKDFPEVGLLNFKHYVVSKPFTDQEILDKHFLNEVVRVFKMQKEFNTFLNKAIADYKEED